LVLAIDRLDCLLSFFQFFFWKNDLRSEAEQAIKRKQKTREQNKCQIFKTKTNYEHHRKTDKRCGSTHLVERKTGSKLFSSDQRQLP
jgi:hypothetical protein